MTESLKPVLGRSPVYTLSEDVRMVRLDNRGAHVFGSQAKGA